MVTAFGGDLYHLWRISEVLLPRVADVYYESNQRMGGSAGKDNASGFRTGTTTTPYGASYSSNPNGEAWEALRTELQCMYAEIGTTVLEAAEAVRQAQRAYEDRDKDSGAQLQTILKDPLLHPTAPESNPPVPGSAEDPGKPILPS